MSALRQLPLIDVYAVSPTFVDEVAAIVTVGGTTHLTFACREPETDGSVARVVQARLIVPTDQLKAIGRAILAGQVITVPVREDGEPIALQ
jgi:hypothetical protein